MSKLSYLPHAQLPTGRLFRTVNEALLVLINGVTVVDAELRVEYRRYPGEPEAPDTPGESPWLEIDSVELINSSGAFIGDNVRELRERMNITALLSTTYLSELEERLDELDYLGPPETAHDSN